MDVARNQLARESLRKQAKYLFFVDSDVLTSPEALLLLHRWHLPIVSGVYYTKRGYIGAWRRDPDVSGMYNPVAQMPTGGLVEVDAVAAGVLLIDTGVFRLLPEPWFQWTMKDPTVHEGLSEDMGFSRLAQDHGLKILVDPQCVCWHEMLLPVDTTGKSENSIYKTDVRKVP